MHLIGTTWSCSSNLGAGHIAVGVWYGEICPRIKTETKKPIRKVHPSPNIRKGIPIEIIGYYKAEPMAWCSIAPRDSYKNLKGATDLDNVWSLVCFLIKREYRQKGIMALLVEESIRFAKANGAKYIEAYPVAPDSPSYRFMGFKPLFDDLGFECKQMAGKRRHVMSLEIK